jgi:Sigma-70 region 2
MGLLRRAEPAGYEDFVASRYREIVRFGALLTGDGLLGEDLAQEGLIAAYRAWHRLGVPDGRPEAYVRQVMVRITWPAGPPAPPSGGLALPDRITSVTTDVPPTNGMAVATDAETLTRIRTKLAELRDPVPAGEECTLRKPGSVGISLGEVTVVLGDATCPQAISTGGGRVRVPAGLGKELLDLIVASDRAATERAATPGVR